PSSLALAGSVSNGPQQSSAAASSISSFSFSINASQQQARSHAQPVVASSQSVQQQPPPPPPPGPPLDRLATLPLSLRQAPVLEVCANAADRQSAELHWNLRGLVPDRQQQIASYSVWYCYQRPGLPAEAWAKTADLRALPLPMRCQVGIDTRRGACHFVLRAEDAAGRSGRWSNVVTWPPAGSHGNHVGVNQRRSYQHLL
uniref:Fibronectin type-III domain-containing protein n=2 Tax=Macrostomum lignano TaxID=282301 RepID=A0A1I8HJ36_9PLAT